MLLSKISKLCTRSPGESANVNATATQGLILFDTNGEEEPNIIGNDRFILPVGDGGIQYE